MVYWPYEISVTVLHIFSCYFYLDGIKLFFWVALLSHCLSTSFCISLLSEHPFAEFKWAVDILSSEIRLSDEFRPQCHTFVIYHSLAITEDVPSCFILEPIESRARAISLPIFLFVVGNFRVLCSQEYWDIDFLAAKL